MKNGAQSIDRCVVDKAIVRYQVETLLNVQKDLLLQFRLDIAQAS